MVDKFDHKIFWLTGNDYEIHHTITENNPEIKKMSLASAEIAKVEKSLICLPWVKLGLLESFQNLKKKYLMVN